MNQFLAAIIAANQTQDEYGNTVELHSGVSQEEIDFISSLIRDHHLSRAVEVGCAMGMSSLAISDAIKDEGGSVHYIIDPHQKSQWKNIGISNLKRAGFADVTFIEDYSEFALPALVKKGVRVNFGFIDGWHTFDHTLIDFFYINRMLEVGGVVVIDDVQMPAINKMIRYLYNYPGYRFAGKVRNKAITAKRKLFSKATAVIGGLRHLTGRRIAAEIYSPKLLRSDEALQLDSSMIAFKKISPDERDWNWYANF